MKTLTITRPDDMHLHVRNGALLKAVLPYTAKQFARAVIMPNLKPPVTTVEQAFAYREEILAAIPENLQFTPLMTLYLTASTSTDEIRKAAESEFVHAFKLYPAGATTHSDAGVADIKSAYPLFETMEKHDIPLLVHGEVTEPECDIFDRERVFIDRYLSDMAEQFPGLRIVFEHATTREAVQFVESAGPNVAATLTPQHLLYNRNAVLAGGIRPHFYCLPVLKREQHRQALINAAISGNPKFFLGTDSAPHLTSLKENSCGCAGCFSAPIALELYADAFELNDALDKLDAFAGTFGANFYGLPKNTGTVTLQKMEWNVPASCTEDGITITPLNASEKLNWKIV